MARESLQSTPVVSVADSSSGRTSDRGAAPDPQARSGPIAVRHSHRAHSNPMGATRMQRCVTGVNSLVATQRGWCGGLQVIGAEGLAKEGGGFAITLGTSMAVNL